MFSEVQRADNGTNFRLAQGGYIGVTAHRQAGWRAVPTVAGGVGRDRRTSTRVAFPAFRLAWYA